jgi:aspartyl-tRNA(Asn)/glutamyl-tRNA(Gln) amidotransferase subunit A
VTKSAPRSAVSRTEEAFARIFDRDGDIRSFVATLSDSALADAEASDRRRDEGCLRGPLDGLGFAVKDNLAVAGLPTWSGTRAFDTPSPRDATVVARMRAAGMILIGTLNMHEGALGATTDNPFWGRCMNPLRPGFTPGGSSGGSAAAIAAGLVPVTLGTDTMGSVRIPAAYCGLWGLKPTRGSVPATGLTHLSWTLDTIGPLARDPATLADVLRIIEGPDPADPMSAPNMREPDLPDGIAGLRLGVPDVASLAECEPAVLSSFEAFLTALREAEAVVEPICIAGWEPGTLRRAGLLISEVEGAEVIGSRLDGPGFSDAFRAMLDHGRRADPVRLARAYREVQRLSVAFDHAIDGLDGILLPTAPQRAFPHEAAVPLNQADFTALANVSGAPALTIPLSAPDGGLPCAAQILGQRWSDHWLTALGCRIAALTPVRRNPTEPE